MMALFMAGACYLTYHFLALPTFFFTHFCYVPIILAALWWKLRGVIVAVFLGGQLIYFHMDLVTNVSITENYFRAVMFITMAFVMGILSERYTETKEQISDYEDELRGLALELSLAEEREKHRIAVELHDNLGQELTLFRLKLEELKSSSQSVGLAEELDRVSAHLKQTIRSLRSLTFDLSSSTLYELGFEKAVAEWLAARVEQGHGIRTELISKGQWETLDENISVILFQAVRELLVNVVKHAQASWVKVVLEKDAKKITILVQDDGIGFIPTEKTVSTKTTGKLGLFSIRERMGYLGGSVEIESRPKHGSRITLKLPLQLEKKKEFGD